MATIGDLKRFLDECILDDSAEIVLSKDAEGNGFSPFSDCSAEMYVAESTYSGDIYDIEEAPDESKIVLVLWPAN